jgi:hypothetical protein
LIPVVGTPIAQLLVNGSALAFDSIIINAPTETSFSTDIKGAITKTGPLDAEIASPNPVTVSYNGKALGVMQMPTVKAIANQGAALDLKTVPFTISDGAAFADFTSFALNNEKFEWTISTTGIVVNAMGASLPGVSMTKTVTLDGFNKLPGLTLLDYTINAIDATGLHMVISATLANPSTIGMTIPVSQFNTQFHGAVLGPAFAYNMGLVPHSSSSFALNATISADGSNKTPYLKGIFQNALGGVATPLEAKGVAAPGVSWLDTAIKSLLLNTELPPLREAPISSVVINSMEMDFACESCIWEPTAISSITADTKLPFSTGAPIKQLAQNVQILDKNGQLVGNLNTPYAGVTLDGSKVSTSTPAAPLKVPDGSHDIYTTFISDLNMATTYELGLRGSADSILSLGPFGDIEIKGIPIDVKTSLAGLQGLNNIKFLAYIDNQISFDPPRVNSRTSVNIHNPSQLTLNIGDLALEAGRDYNPENWVGNTLIENLRLVPGDNNVVTVLSVDTGSNPAAEKFLADLNIMDILLKMWASPTATKNPALNTGLSTLRNSVLLPMFLMSFTPPAFSDVWNIKILPNTVNDGLVEMSTTFSNPFLVDMSVEGVAAQDEGSFTQYPSTAELYVGGYKYTNLQFVDNFSYTVKTGESKTVNFMMKLRRDIVTADNVVKVVADFINDAADGSMAMEINWYPRIRLAGQKTLTYPLWAGTPSYFYPDHPLILKTGSDFPLIKDWFYKEFGLSGGAPVVPAPPVASPPPAVTPNPPSPTPSTIPNPSPPPSSLPPAPQPTPVAPSPPPPPAVTPSPTIAPAA